MPDSANFAVATALAGRWRDYRAQYKACKRDFSEEAIHDLRVATRRLLAVLDVTRSADSHPRLQKMRRALKNQLDGLDDLRDVQVMLVQIAESLERRPGLNSFHGHLQKQESRLRRSARKQIRNSKPSEHSQRIKRIRTVLERQSGEPVLAMQALQAVDNAYARATRAYDQVDGEQAASIHGVRIAFKKFRYMTEVILPLLPAYPASNLERMHTYQGRMGDIQDMDILIHALSDFAGRRRLGTTEQETAFDPEPIRRHYANRQAELIRAYLADKGELLSFWRAAPDQPFPWEKQNDPLHHPSRDRRASEPGGRAGRQPAPIDRQGPQENAPDSPGPEGAGSPDRPDLDQSLPAGE